MSRDRSIGVAPKLQVGQAMNSSSIHYTGDRFIFSKATRTALGHSQLSTQYKSRKCVIPVVCVKLGEGM